MQVQYLALTQILHRTLGMSPSLPPLAPSLRGGEGMVGGPQAGAGTRTSHMCSWNRRRSFCVSSVISTADSSVWMTPAIRVRSFSFSSFALGRQAGRGCY